MSVIGIEWASTLSGTAPAAVAGKPYSYAFAVTSTPAATVAVTTGTLPTGLSLILKPAFCRNPTQSGTFPVANSVGITTSM